MTNPHPLTEVELLPCPFCGSAGDMLRMSGNGADTFWVSCDICECDGPVAAKETAAGAIEGWNIRSSSAQPSTEAVKLADDLAEMATGLRGSMWANRNEIIALLDRGAAALRGGGHD